jgi:uncharacterized membrane protein
MKDLFIVFVAVIASAIVIAFISYECNYTDPYAQAMSVDQIHQVSVGNNTYWVPNYKGE